MDHYTVVKAKTVKQLDKKVSELITKGYRPLGGVAVSGGYLYQAMAQSI